MAPLLDPRPVGDDRPRRERIELIVRYLVTDLLYYDRKDSTTLSVDEIELAVLTGEVTVVELLEWFGDELVRALDQYIPEAP